VISGRSYWIPGSYTPTASEKRSPFLKPLKNKVFQESRLTTIALDDIGTSTTLESNKSVLVYHYPFESVLLLAVFVQNERLLSQNETSSALRQASRRAFPLRMSRGLLAPSPWHNLCFVLIQSTPLPALWRYRDAPPT